MWWSRPNRTTERGRAGASMARWSSSLRESVGQYVFAEATDLGRCAGDAPRGTDAGRGRDRDGGQLQALLGDADFLLFGELVRQARTMSRARRRTLATTRSASARLLATRRWTGAVRAETRRATPTSVWRSPPRTTLTRRKSRVPGGGDGRPAPLRRCARLFSVSGKLAGRHLRAS